MSNTYHHDYRGKKNKFGIELMHCYKADPKWWRKMVKHNPQRVKERQAINNIMRGKFDEIDFPLDKKPHIYYD